MGTKRVSAQSGRLEKHGRQKLLGLEQEPAYSTVLWLLLGARSYFVAS